MSLIFLAVLFTNKGSSFYTYTITFIFLQGDGFSTRSEKGLIDFDKRTTGRWIPHTEFPKIKKI